MHKTLKKPIGEQEVEQCFKMIDGEENEFITMRGLEKIFLAVGQQRTDEELRDMVSFIDSEDEEGLIRYKGMWFSYIIYKYPSSNVKVIGNVVGLRRIHAACTPFYVTNKSYAFTNCTKTVNVTYLAHLCKMPS